jgi:hypothetical protein
VNADHFLLTVVSCCSESHSIVPDGTRPERYTVVTSTSVMKNAALPLDRYFRLDGAYCRSQWDYGTLTRSARPRSGWRQNPGSGCQPWGLLTTMVRLFNVGSLWGRVTSRENGFGGPACGLSYPHIVMCGEAAHSLRISMVWPGFALCGSAMRTCYVSVARSGEVEIVSGMPSNHPSCIWGMPSLPSPTVF